MRAGWRWLGARRARGGAAALAAWMFLSALLSGMAWTVRASTVAILPPPQPLEGSQPYATLLCKFADADAEPLTPAYFDRLMLDGPESLDQYWRRVSNGKIDLAGSKAFGWFAAPSGRDAYRGNKPGTVNLEALARDCAGAADPSVDFRPFTGINLVFNKCLQRPRGGEMALLLDGERRRFRVTWLCPGPSASHHIVAHEMGHSFGLTHSEDAEGDEYGNTWDLMSVAAYCAADSDFGYMAQAPIAFNKDLLGWIPPDRKFRSPGGEARTIVLDGPEAQGSGYLLAEIPLGRGRAYTVEARLRAGFDHGLPAAGVLVHEVDHRRPNKAQLVSPQRSAAGDLTGLFGGWSVGSVFFDAQSGVSVRVDRALDEGFVVTISHDTPPDTAMASAPRLGHAPDASAPPVLYAGRICADATRN